MKRLLLLISIAVICGTLRAEALEHPNIWVTQSERGRVLELVERCDWAKEIVRQLEEIVGESVDLHTNQPSYLLDVIPAFATTQNPTSVSKPIATKHISIVGKAYYAAVLYYITEDKRYAQFAADVFSIYAERIAPLTPETTMISGNSFTDPRTTYASLALIYDFTYNYLNRPKSKVFSERRRRYVAFDNDVAQRAITNMVGNAMQEYGAADKHGKVVSNHPVLKAPGPLYGILCLDDEAERDRLLNLFWEVGTKHQNSFKNTILPLFSEQGIWPESVSYGFMPNVTLVLSVLDRAKPEWDVTREHKSILEGNFFFDYLRNPDRTFVCYGDSHRYNDNTRDLYLYTLDIARRRGYTDLVDKARLALSQSYRASGGYHPEMKGRVHDNFKPLELLWGESIGEEEGADVDFNMQSVIVEHAGVALQRNTIERDNELYGLCGIIGGAHYVHSHLTGITMELYGAEYIMTPNGSLPTSVEAREFPIHENYYRIYAGNNTVVVNGTSHGEQKGAWKAGACVWQNRAVNVASEPRHMERGASRNFSFATQRLDDEVNRATQERTLAILRTSDTTAYYFDMFRSRSLGENLFHDYIYHNLGDKMHLTTIEGEPLTTSPTDRYQNDTGDPVQSPGWRYFEQTRATDGTMGGVKLRFDVEYDGRYMHMLLPSGVEREYTTATAPPTRESRNGYVDKPTQVLVVRQEGEAWERPFISILEPSCNAAGSVESVEPICDGGSLIGAKVVSNVKGARVVDYIINQSDEKAEYRDKSSGVSFTGRYGVVRVTNDCVTLYIGKGECIKYKGFEINANREGVAFEEFRL